MPDLPPIRGRFRTDDRARAAYAEGAGIYRIIPEAVCLPHDVADLERLVAWAAEERRALIPRGAGSAMGGGNVGLGIVVDLTAMADPALEIDARHRVARASGSVTLAQLNDAAARHGLRLPPDPSSGRWATLGGVLATNAAGARTVRYGSARRWATAATMVTADAETVTLKRRAAARGTLPVFPPVSAVTRFERDVAPAIRGASALIRARFPATRKNSSGYALDAYLESGDVLDLLLGAEGTLGIVTATEWRLDPIPAARGGIRVALRSIDALGDAVQALAPHEPSAVELLDRSFLDLVRPRLPASLAERLRDADAILLIELERDDDRALKEAIEASAASVGPWAGAVDVALGPEEAERFWTLRHAASPILAGLPEDRRSLQVIEDGCVPVPQLGAYVRAVREAAARARIAAVLFGHAGDGHLHVNLLPELAREGWERDVARLLDEVSETVARLGGTLSGEHGDGRLRAPFLERIYGAEVVQLFRLVKEAFDPLGILNPGVILPAPHADPTASLKVGRGAVALPPDVARALREIERTGGYARRRIEIADAGAAAT